ncbi:periplasmic heavy metal sensor [Falsiroseomonas selenitidurans]|uniref:Periplasmic heavy metal sensor n=1 Tax=Falsiroseomonas selenitidurans TaxID=2716335 RepID=A0ABX1E7E4_9PROT|nr:periplasmic heavy metal sensor [Falsiroseomonas selenitidurans]NKC32883.1 periplasmic heavy metal sensor [Falsiroseomonas selenitidurans]
MTQPLTPAARMLRRLLLASLALNLFLGGFLLARTQHRPPTPAATLAWPDSETAAMAALRRLAEVLPAQDAAVLREVALRRLPGFLAARTAFLERVATARAAMQQEPLDEARLAAALEAIGADRLPFAELARQVLLEAVPLLSPEGRRTLAAFELRRP